MLNVTDAALEYLSQVCARATGPESMDACFRLVMHRNGGAVSLNLETPFPDDHTWEHGGEVVLAVPDALVDFCAQRTLDLDDGGELILR